jgi:uncharacterized membrane protein YphA (DoxX/SURF4 family)
MIRNKDFLIIITRLFLGYIFFSSGLCKLTHGHFGQIIGPPLLENTLAQYGLALFARIIAVMQVACGILLLSQRFSTVGAIMLLPMNLSILAVTISLGWQGTPYVNGFFVALNLLLLLYDWHKLKVLILPNQASAVKPTVADNYSYNAFNLIAITFAVAAMIASRYSLLFTNIFALATFVLIAYSLIQIKTINRLQTIIVMLVVLNMVLITLGNVITFARYILGGNSIVIVLLLVLSLFKTAALRKEFATA